MPKGTPAKKITEVKMDGTKEYPVIKATPKKDWNLLPGEKVTPFTLPEDKPARTFSGLKEAVTSGWTESTFTAQVDRDELERLLGGDFEDVAGEPSRRSNQKFETYSDGADCYCYQCPRGSKPPVVARTWADVATRMGV